MALLAPFFRAVDANGDPLSGAKLYLYVSGTTTPQTAYTTYAMTVAHAHPVVADSGGLFAPIYLNPRLYYRAILKTADGSTIQDIDPVAPISASTATDFGAIGDGTADDSAAFTSYFANSYRFDIPAGTYRLGSTVTLAGRSFSWSRDPSASFTGSGVITATDLPGNSYAPDLRKIPSIENLGSIATPVTDKDPARLVSKTSLTPDIGGNINSAFAVQHYHYGTVGQSKATGIFVETVVKAGGTSVFGEAVRGHAIVPSGIIGKANAACFYSENGGTGANAVPVEAEIRRTIASDCPAPRSYISTSQLDANFCATAHTANATVGGTGGKPLAGFYINPFNSIAHRCAVWVPASVVSGKTVDHSVVSCQETGLVYGIDLAKGSYSTAAIALPNNSKVTAFNNVGSPGTSELEILKLDTSDILQLGAGTNGVAIGGGAALTKVAVYAPSITPSAVGAATVTEQAFTVSGLTTADKVIVNPPAIGNATGIVGARVSAADTLAIRFVNPTAGSLTPSSGTYTVLAFRS